MKIFVFSWPFIQYGPSLHERDNLPFGSPIQQLDHKIGFTLYFRQNNFHDLCSAGSGVNLTHLFNGRVELYWHRAKYWKQARSHTGL